MKTSVTSVEACFDLVKIWGSIVQKKNSNICSNIHTRGRMMGLFSEETKECCVGCVEHCYDFFVNECGRMRT